MCIAINSPKGTEPSKSAMEESFRNNPHGGGFAYSKNNKVIIKKGFETFKDFHAEYKRANIKGLNKLIHFRIKTSGKIDYDNCHPFYVTHNLAMIHNGVIPKFGNNVTSDTREFISMVLKPIILKHGLNILNNPTFINTIEDIIGDSKLVFLDNEGNTYYINKDLGHDNSGIWYSNDSYMNYNSWYMNDDLSYEWDSCKLCKDCGQVIDKGVDETNCEDCIEFGDSYQGFHFR